MSLPRFSVANPVCVNLVMMSIMILGLAIYAVLIPKEIFPEFSQQIITVTTIYPGAGAEEIEKNVTIRIEDVLVELTGVDEIMSVSQEGISKVTLKISPDEDDMARMTADVQQAIDTVEDFPEDADEPNVKEIETSYPVITVSLFGDVNLLHLKEIVEDLKEELENVSGVAEVRVSGLPERELWVEVQPEALERYGLSMADVANSVSKQNLDLPGGNLPTEDGEFLVRTMGKAEESGRLGNIMLKTTPIGGKVRVADVARVRDWFEKETTLGRFNMRRSVNLNVTKKRDGDAIKVSENIRELVDKYRPLLPATVDVGVFNDMSVYIKNRLNVLKDSGLQGLVIVFCLLLVMLNFRTSIMVTLGIPISFFGTFIIMYYFGMTMNMVAMFSLIVVLGLIVDDAVVIGENIYRYYEQGMSPREAAVKGAEEVTWPVVSAIATTICAFVPLLLMPGNMGVFLSVIPMIVIFSLMVSLVEALFILPSHMADFLPETPPKPSRIRERLNDRIEIIIAWYGGRLNRVLDNRYVFMIAVVCITVVIVVFTATRVKFVLFSSFEGAQFFVNVEGAPSKSLDETAEIVGRVEHVVRGVVPDDEFVSMVTNVGYIMDDFDNVRTGRNLAQTIVELREFEKGRDRPLKDVLTAVRAAVEPLQNLADVRIKELSAGPGGAPIYLLLTGKNLDVLKSLAERMKSFVRGFSGVSDLKDNMEAGKPELQVRLRPEAYALGLDDFMVARELRSAFWGAESSKFQTSSEDIDVRVKLPEDRKERVEALLRYKLTLPGGSKVPLVDVADVVKVRGLGRIVREDAERSIAVTGELDQTQTTAAEIAEESAKYFVSIQGDHPGYSLTTERGEVKDINESMAALKVAFLLALMLIYFILGTQFKSYVQPFIVMSAIPFGIDGVLLGHIFLGMDLGLFSLIGLVALSGIVVNDSLVLVDFVNKRREAGTDRRSSLVEAGMLRFRPVTLTSMTTMGGLFFLAFLAQGQAKFLSPMAVSIFFGLMFATAITLFIVPCLYAIADDLVLRLRFGRRNAE